MTIGKAAIGKNRVLTSDALGRRGEAHFESMCTEANLLPQAPKHDRHGWDFLVEFPHEGAHEVADLVARQEPMQCFVQVKTVWEGARKVDLTLSAAARLAKSPLPTFLCILEAGPDAAIRRLHVLHLSGPLLERTLRQLREMQAAGQSTRINKVTFPVPVPKPQGAAPPTGVALRSAFELAVGPDYAAYRREKESFIRTAGFPPRPISGTFSVKVETPSDHTDFMLGLRPLPVLDFRATETRWDISIPYNLPSKPASITWNPKARDVEVVWRRPGAIRSVRLTMAATFASGSALGGSGDSWLLVHPNFEMLVHGSSSKFSMKLSSVPIGYQTLVQIHALEELLGSGGAIEMQMLFRHKLIARAQLDGPLRFRSYEMLVAQDDLLKDIGAILTQAGLNDVQLRLDGLSSQWRQQLRWLRGMLEHGDEMMATLAIEVPEGSVAEAGERETLYVTALEFSDQLLGVYATCRGLLEAGGTAGDWRFKASDFVVRELRLVEASDEAMLDFAREAERATGLDSSVFTWGDAGSASTRL